MRKEGDEVHIEVDDARGGSTPHIVRYVLAASLALVVVALSAIWITGALSTDGRDQPVETGAEPGVRSAE